MSTTKYCPKTKLNIDLRKRFIEECIIILNKRMTPVTYLRNIVKRFKRGLGDSTGVKVILAYCQPSFASPTPHIIH